MSVLPFITTQAKDYLKSARSLKSVRTFSMALANRRRRIIHVHGIAKIRPIERARL